MRKAGHRSHPRQSPPRQSRGLCAIRVLPYKRHNAADWQAYVERHPHGTIFHGLAWKQAIERSFGHRSLNAMAYRGDRVVGVLPLFEVRSILAGRLLISVPYATYGGVLGDDQEISAPLFAHARRLGEEIGARSIQLRSIRATVPSLDIQRTHVFFRKPLPSAGTTDQPKNLSQNCGTGVSPVLHHRPEACATGGFGIGSDQSSSEEDVLASFPRKARAAARRAMQRYQLTVQFGDEHLSAVWQLYARSMRRLASPNYPYRFFEELVRATPGEHVVQLVHHQGRPVAGLLTFLYRDEVLPYFMGLDDRAGLYGLSHYLYYQSMLWGVRQGYRFYDFGRTRIDNTGSYNFKRLCGFEPTALEYQICEMTGRSAPDLSPSSPRWRTARRIWKVLPLTVTRPLGSWLAKSIPG